MKSDAELGQLLHLRDVPDVRHDRNVLFLASSTIASTTSGEPFSPSRA
jgi:hypothetical protein